MDEPHICLLQTKMQIMIWTGSEDDFNNFMIEINKLQPQIYMLNDFKTRSTTFLYTLVRITDKGIETDLYRKPTDRIGPDRIHYQLPSSCHPGHTFKSIPYSIN